MTDVTIQDVMAAYARDAVVEASKNGFALDFSEKSLDAVDRILCKITEKGFLTPKSEKEESDVWTLSKRYGGYLGQVVINEVGGDWELIDLKAGAAQVILRSHGVQMFPLEKVYKRLVSDEYSGVSGYCRALRLIIQTQNEKPRE